MLFDWRSFNWFYWIIYWLRAISVGVPNANPINGVCRSELWHTHKPHLSGVCLILTLFFSPAFALCRVGRTRTDCCQLNRRQTPRAEE